MRIDHIAIAVRSLERSLKEFEAIWGLSVASSQQADSDAVREAMLPIGNTSLQLLEATTPESTVAKFIERRGEGLHHIAIGVDDIVAALDRLRAAGASLIDEVPRPAGQGRMAAFVHPRTSAGVLIELIQEAPPAASEGANT